MAKVVILGAGLTGLSTAYHLEEQGFFDYKLFEKKSKIGGLCKSVIQDGFTFDYTGHLLHINDPIFNSFIDKVVDVKTFNRITRKSFIYSHNTHTPYPFQMNLYGLPEDVIVECIEGFVTRNQSPALPENYHQWVKKVFGAGFGNHFFFPYQNKIFAYDVRKLTHTWTGRFVPSTSLRQIIRGAITPASESSIGYNATFLYPQQGGIISWLQKIADQIINPIHINMCAIKIDMKHKVVHFANGHCEPFEKLISTMPLNLLLKKIDEPASLSLKSAHKNLLCNSVVNVNFGIKDHALSGKSWVYYPEKQYHFYRIGFPHTFSPFMAPDNCSSLYIEIAHLNKSKTFVKQITKKAIEQAKTLLGIHDAQTTMVELHLPHAYVIYNHWREKNLPALHKRLQELNIHSIGRYGEWKYASMQEAVLDGRSAAQKIISTAEKKLFIVPPHKKSGHIQKGA